MRLLLSRRVTAAALSLVFTLQSAGSALAMSPQGISIDGLPLRVQIGNALQSLRTTQVGAILSGDGARWAAMHAPPPVFKHEMPQVVLPARHVIDLRQFQPGVFRAGPHMLNRTLNINEVPKDPRAMSQGTPPCARIGQVCRTPVLLPNAGIHIMSMVTKIPLLRTSASVQTMSITPTVQPFLFEADTTNGPTTPIFVTAGIESGAISRTMDSAPASPAANQMLTYAPYSGSVSFGWVSPANVPNSASWPAQTYTVTLNVRQANPNLKIIVVKVLRVDSSGGGGTGTDGLATVGALTGLSQSLGTAGTLTFNVTGAVQTASATDRIAVKIVVENTATTTQSFSYLAGQNSGSGLNLGRAGTLGTSTTGKKLWWNYEPGTLPGIGQYMVNVGNGNLVLQSSDVDTRERGIDLAFRRTYNSQSTHDVNNTDASVPSNYGDGWTNNFDAHLAYHGANTISLYDVDGARYDYAGNGNGGWVPPVGQYAILKWDGACGYQWTKKDGTIYYFYSPDLNDSPTCSEFNPSVAYPQDSAYGGRLYKIWARNHNNSITLAYSWNPDATNPSNLRGITATHADGHVLTLTFGPSLTGGPTELQKLTRPDGQVINYIYDGANPGNLVYVQLPGNSSVSTLTQGYGYKAGSHALNAVGTPRYELSSSDGNITNFAYDSSYRVTQASDTGLVSFTPNDGTATQLQPTPSPSPSSSPLPLQTWRIMDFSGYGTGTTTMTDHDGHGIIWSIDNNGRVKNIQESTGETSPTYLVTTPVWDANNNLIATIDPRSNQTDYAFDTNGNTIAVALPLVTTNQGTFRPTSLYSYDSFNNIVAYCDAVQTHALGKDWTSNPGTGDSLCPQTTGATLQAWTYPSYQPFGQRSAITAPATASATSGYKFTFVYGAAQQSGTDFGLVTSIAGSMFTQTDGTSRTPTQNIVYNSLGDITSVDPGNGARQFGYDNMNRRTSAVDPDSGSPTTCTWYYADGSIQAQESPSERGATGSSSQCSPLAASDSTAVQYTYDADGDETAELHHFSCITGQTCPDGTTHKWYDGGDRLVEVSLPQDPRADSSKVSYDYFTFPEMTRYLYDLSLGKGVNFAGTAINAHGQLYAVQQYVGSAPSTGSWTQTNGTAYDALNRVVSVLNIAVCPSALTASSANTPELCSSTVQSRTNTYDATTQSYGLLSSGIYENGSASFTYDNDAQVLTNSALGTTYTYDADGRVSTIADAFGTRGYSYDSAGELTQETEPPGGTGANTLTNPVYLQYGYYPDGTTSSLTAATQAGGAQLFALSYANRADGLRQYEKYTYATTPSVVKWNYTAAGRPQSVTAPWGANTQSFTFDGFGRLSGFTTTQSTVSGLTYDDEGEKLTENISNPASSLSYLYNVRGELIGDNASGTLVVKQQSANGVMLPTPSRKAVATAWDVRSGAVVGQTYNTIDRQTKVDYTAIRTFSYDSQGRSSSVEDNGVTPYTDGNGTICHIGSDITSSRAYDGAGHLYTISQTATQYPPLYTNPLTCPPNDTPSTVNGPNLRYAYGSNERPTLVSASSGAIAYYPTTLHWDGDAPLFESASNTGILDVFLGTFADTFPNGPSSVTIDDRDDAGYMVERDYSSTSSSNYATYDPFDPSGYLKSFNLGSASNYGSLQSNIYLDMPRIDGLTDGSSQLQGVRDYDKNALQWTEPDPGSGSSYTWTGNNPLANSDPSGFYSEASSCDVFCQNPPPPFPNNDAANGDPFGAYRCSPCAVPWFAPPPFPHSLIDKLACPTGNHDVAVYELGAAEGPAVGVSGAVTAYGDVFIGPQVGAGAGANVGSGSVMQGNVANLTPGSASRSRINAIVGGESHIASAGFGVAVATMKNENGQINLKGVGWPAAFVGIGWGYAAPHLHRNCYRH